MVLITYSASFLFSLLLQMMPFLLLVLLSFAPSFRNPNQQNPVQFLHLLLLQLRRLWIVIVIVVVATNNNNNNNNGWWWKEEEEKSRFWWRWWRKRTTATSFKFQFAQLWLGLKKKRFYHLYTIGKKKNSNPNPPLITAGDSYGWVLPEQ